MVACLQMQLSGPISSACDTCCTSAYARAQTALRTKLVVLPVAGACEQYRWGFWRNARGVQGVCERLADVAAQGEGLQE